MDLLRTERSALLDLVERFPRQHIVMWGDLVADESVYGEIARVSREAPVLILKQRERLVLPGGGGNAANNLADLDARVFPVSVIGDDETGEALYRYFSDKQVTMRHVIRVPKRLTPTKTRFLGGVTHWQRQQIVRLDREPSGPLPPAIRDRLRRSVLSLSARTSGLLVSDYGYGTTSAREAEIVRRRQRAKSIPFAVDSRFDLPSYKNFSAATPNEPELEAVFGEQIGDNLERLHTLGKKFLRRQGLGALLVTRGRDGVALFEPRRPPRHIPVFGSEQAVDVTGAGDTVIATFTLALAAGASPLQAALLANCAGGLVVMKRGTATVSRREITEAIRNL